MSRHQSAIAAAAFLAVSSVPAADPAMQEGGAVRVEAQTEAIVVDADLRVQATPPEVWAVLTDYNHMAEFLPNINFSKATKNGDGKVEVEQKAKAYFGPFSVTLDSVRDVTLTPYSEIQTRLISGSFHRLDTTTRLFPAEGGTRILYHSESVPTVHLARSIVVPMTERGVRDYFDSVKAEVRRRQENGGSTR